MKTIAFDMYGTLIDLSGAAPVVAKYVKTELAQFLLMFGNTQVEFYFRRALMKKTAPHPTLTRDALDYCLKFFGETLTEEQKSEILATYVKLPAFADVKEGLMKLKKAGYKLYPFSGGTKEDITALMAHNELLELFDGIISAGDVGLTKPMPEAYEYFNKATNSEKENTWLVSSNPFDIMGASEYGFKTAWIKRTEQSISEPWFKNKNLTGANLSEVADIIILEDK